MRPISRMGPIKKGPIEIPLNRAFSIVYPVITGGPEACRPVPD